MRESENIDSCGIGSLVVAHIEVKKKSGRLVIVMPSSFFDAQRLLTAPTPIYEVFEVYRSREEAIEALLDPTIVPDRVESEAGRKAPGCLESACAVFLISAAMLVAAWLK